MNKKSAKKEGYWGFVIIGLVAFLEGLSFLFKSFSAIAEMRPIEAILYVALGIFFVGVSLGIHNKKRWAFFGGMALGIKYLINAGAHIIIIFAAMPHISNRLMERVILNSAIGIVIYLLIAIGIIAYLYKHRASFNKR